MTAMTRFLLAGALAAGALFTVTTPASACQPITCEVPPPVCDAAHVDCLHPVCFETPEISYCP